MWFLFFLMSCSSYDLGAESPIEVAVDPSNPVWENGVQSIMEKKCDNCHGSVQSEFVPGNAKGLDYNFGIKANFQKKSARITARVLTTKDMPPEFATPLTATELAAVKKYLELNP